MDKNHLLNSSGFRTVFINSRDPFYRDKDNDSGDVFQNNLVEERLQENVEDDINSNIYNALDVVGQQVILSENMYDNVKQVFTKYSCS